MFTTRHTLHFAIQASDDENTIHALAEQSGLKAYTLTPGTGYWEGIQEPCWSLVVYTTADDIDDIIFALNSLANAIKMFCHQEAVLYVEEQVQGWLL